MNYDFWNIGRVGAAPRNVSLARLATHIATDWVPTSPTSVATGLTALLNEVLERQPLSGTDHWLTRESVRTFERQWRSVTSYTLGVAFCVETFLSMGYSWWAPVSFWKHNRAANMPFVWWSPLFNTLQCEIRPDPSNPSRLMPDFVLARRDPSGGVAIAFAEAKGWKWALQNRHVCPASWRNQARNAVFELSGNQVTPAQNIVVATRITPDGKRMNTRRVQVRAWNSSAQATHIPMSAAREILLLHYAGICMKLGMRNTAKLLAHAPMRARQQEMERQGSRQSNASYFNELLDMAGSERIERPVRSNAVPEMISTEGAVFPIGEIRLRIGFSRAAAYMLDALAHWDVREIDHLTEKLAHEAEHVAQSGDDQLVSRRDGVVGVIEE